MIRHRINGIQQKRILCCHILHSYLELDFRVIGGSAKGATFDYSLPDRYIDENWSTTQLVELYGFAYKVARTFVLKYEAGLHRNDILLLHLFSSNFLLYVALQTVEGEVDGME